MTSEIRYGVAAFALFATMLVGGFAYLIYTDAPQSADRFRSDKVSASSCVARAEQLGMTANSAQGDIVVTVPRVEDPDVVIEQTSVLASGCQGYEMVYYCIGVACQDQGGEGPGPIAMQMRLERSVPDTRLASSPWERVVAPRIQQARVFVQKKTGITLPRFE